MNQVDNLVVVDEPIPTTPTLFHSDSPALIIDEATEIANQLSDIIKTKHLYKNIGQKAHVFVEGWTTLGALLGVFPYPESSIRIDRENEIAYEASVIVRTLGGVEVSKGEAICSSKEANWRTADEYAIKSMATTRATSKALRIPLGWIMVLAGYSATPAEEMMGNGFSKPNRTSKPAPTTAKRVTPKSSVKPKSSATNSDEGMPKAEKVVEGDITPVDWDALITKHPILKQVLKQFNEGQLVSPHTIRRKASDMVGEQLLTPEEKKDIYNILRTV